MPVRFAAGSSVQTPFGKGVVREVRNGGRLLVEIHGRALEFDARDLTPLAPTPKGATRAVRGRPSEPVATSARRAGAASGPSEIDLHGMTVDEALGQAERALNDALLAGRLELRFIHGRSGGRIRGALHRWLGQVPTVVNVRLDPRNPGVTIVTL